MNWVNNTRITATLFVVILHSSAGGMLNNTVGTREWWTANLINTLCMWAVPVFFMLSGALLLDNRKSETSSEFYKKRKARLLIPLLFWTIFYLIWHNQIELMRGNEVTLEQIIRNLAVGKPHYHLWFLYFISLIYLFTPYFRQITRDSTQKELRFFCILILSVALISNIFEVFALRRSFPFIISFLYYIPYFFLGHYLNKSSIRLSRWISLLIIAGLVLLSAAGCYYLCVAKELQAGIYFHGELSITSLAMSVLVFNLLRGIAKPILSRETARYLASLTLGIYLIHPIFIDLIDVKKISLFSDSLLLNIISTTTIVFILSASMTALFKKIPWLDRII